MRKKVYVVYSHEHDMSFVMEDILEDSGHCVTTEVKGFYFGAEDKLFTDHFYGKLKATYVQE